MNTAETAPASGPTGGLLARLHDQRHVLAARIRAAVAADSGEHLEVLSGEIDAMIAHNLPIVLRRLGDRSSYSQRDLEPVRGSATRIAAAGVPREVLLSTLNTAVSSLLDSVWREAGLRERASLLGLIMHGLALAKVITVTINEAYEVDRLRAGRSVVVAARSSLVLALLNGMPVDAAAARAGAELAASYAVVLLLVPSTGGGPGREPAVEDAVDRRLPPGTLTMATSDGATLLVPAGTASCAPSLVRPLLADLATGPAARATAVTAWRPDRSGIPAASVEAREVADVVTRLGRPPGLYVLDDVPIEAALLRAPDLCGRLSARLGPVEDNPRLLAAIEAYLDADGDRRGAAAALHIHPTTLDYRLRQVAVRTGLAPSSLEGLLNLRTALTARRLGAEGWSAPFRAG